MSLAQRNDAIARTQYHKPGTLKTEEYVYVRLHRFRHAKNSPHAMT